MFFIVSHCNSLGLIRGCAMQEFTDEFMEMIEAEPWDSLARIAITFDTEFELTCMETKRLGKEIFLIKHIIHGKLSYENTDRKKFINWPFFVSLVKTIGKLEKSYEKNKIKNRNFIIFLKGLLKKIKKESLYVEKPFEKIKELKKMKDKMENGY